MKSLRFNGLIAKATLANAIIKNKCNNALTRLININKVNINAIG